MGTLSSILAPSGVITPAGAAVLTNKDLTSGTNSFPSTLATLTGTQTLDNKTFTSQNGGQLAGLRNKIINGGMQVTQRGTTAIALSTNTAVFPVDRMRVAAASGGTFTMTGEYSTDAPAGFAASVKVTATTPPGSYSTTTQYLLAQRIEGLSVVDLGWLDGTTRFYHTTYTINSANTWEEKSFTVVSPLGGGKTVTVSFRVKSSLTGTFASSLQTSGSPDSSGFVSVAFDLGSGTDRRSNTINTWGTTNYSGTTTSVRLMDTAGATIQFSGLQVEVGSVATPFEHRPYGQELALCQRYYYRVKSDVVNQIFATGYNISTTQSVVFLPFPVTMRITPTSIEQSGTATDYDLQYLATNTVCSAVPALSGGTAWGVRLVGTVASGLTAGQGSSLRSSTTNAYIGVPAEL